MKSILSLCAFLIASSTACRGLAECQRPPSPSPAETVPSHTTDPKQDRIVLDHLLSKMKAATSQLKSCQSDLAYLFIQDPELLNSRTLRTGTLYYMQDKDKANLRIQFKDIKQDDFEPEKQREEYIFDGVWLKRIDYKLEQVDLYQQAPENKPIGVFELIKHNFPLIGFSDNEDLAADFDVSLASDPNESTDIAHLLLKVKPDSNYKDYSNIDFWVDLDNYLPKRVVAYSVHGDIYDIRFEGLQFNKKLKNAVFTVETPPHFRENIERLKEEPDKKGN